MRLPERMNCSSKSSKHMLVKKSWPRRSAANDSAVKAFECKLPSRKPFPEHLWRERVLIADTLEVVERHWQVIQTVRGEVYLPRV